jgi:hypothetical protein
VRRSGIGVGLPWAGDFDGDDGASLGSWATPWHAGWLSDPGGTACTSPCTVWRCCLLRMSRASAPAPVIVSRLDRFARGASCVRFAALVAQRYATLGSGWWLAFAGQASQPTGSRCEVSAHDLGLHSHLLVALAFPSPRLCLAHGHCIWLLMRDFRAAESHSEVVGLLQPSRNSLDHYTEDDRRSPAVGGIWSSHAHRRPGRERAVVLTQ